MVAAAEPATRPYRREGALPSFGGRFSTIGSGAMCCAGTAHANADKPVRLQSLWACIKTLRMIGGCKSIMAICSWLPDMSIYAFDALDPTSGPAMQSPPGPIRSPILRSTFKKCHTCLLDRRGMGATGTESLLWSLKAMY